MGLTLIQERDFELNRTLGRGVEVWVPLEKDYVHSAHEIEVLYEMRMDFEDAKKVPSEIAGVVGVTAIRAPGEKRKPLKSMIRIAEPNILRRNWALHHVNLPRSQLDAVLHCTLAERGSNVHSHHVPLPTHVPCDPLETDPSSTGMNSSDGLEHDDTVCSEGEDADSEGTPDTADTGDTDDNDPSTQRINSTPTAISVLFWEHDGRVADPAHQQASPSEHSPSRPPRTPGAVFAHPQAPYAPDFLPQSSSAIGIATIPVGFSGDRVRIYDMFDGMNKSKRCREE